MTLLDRLTAPGPKRILALDGGGIRGALSVGFLKRLETIVRERSGQPTLVRAEMTSIFDIMRSIPGIGRTEGLREAMLAYLNDNSGPVERSSCTVGTFCFGQRRSESIADLLSAPNYGV